jgi:cellulose synthase (UDP-forming)
MKMNSKEVFWRKNDHYLAAPTQMLLVALSLVGAYLYARFLFNPANAGDLLPYVLAIAAESFIMFHVLVSVWTIIVGGYNPRNYDYYRVQQEMLPGAYRQVFETRPDIVRRLPRQLPLSINDRTVTIDVFITVYGEPISVIRKTAIAAQNLLGNHKTYILDDGRSDDVRQLAKELGIAYIRRPDNLYAKAGNINYALSVTKGDFFVIFDADFVPKFNFLHETLPFFYDPTVAFVQTPQVYRNYDRVISRGAGYMQSLFYRLIMPGKNRFNAAFCVGTNVMFSRAAILSIGGIYTGSKSEDIWTALTLHEHGYKSIYIPDELAVGETPDSVKAYTKQQLRWATGGMEIFLYHNPLFLRKLTIDQRIQYATTSSYYLLGMATAALMLLPPLQIFFNLTPVNLGTSLLTWLFFYASFYVMQIITAFYTMNGFRLETLLLATVSFPIYVRAFLNALFKKDQKWSATGDRSTIDSPYNYIIPQILIFLFLVFTSVMGVLKYFEQQSISLALMWNTVNAAVFGAYIWIARKEHKALKRQAKRVRTHRRFERRMIKLATAESGPAHE